MILLFSGKTVLRLLTVLMLGVLSGCGKKTEAPPSQTASQEPIQPQPPGADSANVPPPAAPGPTALQPAPATDPNVAIREADAAMKAKQYERAAKALISAQQAMLTEQQAQAARNQMTKLQGELVGAMARGDVQAKAAAELLRRSASGGR